MAGGILTWMTGGDIEAGVFWKRVFLGKQMRAVEGVVTWMIGGDIETSG
jgi:hypothetical protein